MTLLGIFSFLHLTFIDIIDILMVAAIIYFVFHWIRGSASTNIFLAILLLFLLRIVADALNMKMMTALMKTVLDVGVLALLIIFQPEIRRILSDLGRKTSIGQNTSNFFDRLFGIQAQKIGSEYIKEIVDACKEMSEQKTGALIVIPRRDSIRHISETGDQVDAFISKRLIMNIFFKNSPLHDGAMIIRGDRIEAARCTLPITDRQDIPAHYGMRHKAAIGMSEQSDAIVLVVSEETGNISYVHKGEIETVTSLSALQLMLGEAMNKEKKEDNA